MNYISIQIYNQPVQNISMDQFIRAKDEANQFFKLKQYQEALQHFERIRINIEATQNKQYVSPQTQLGKLYVVVLINAALTSINLKTLEHYAKAEQYATKALAVDQKNVKGLYRRGLARKSRAQILENEHGPKHEGLLSLYEKAKKDFEDVTMIQKNNDLAVKYLSTTIKDIYRVTVAKGEEVNFSSKKTEEEGKKSSPYEIPEGSKKKKSDMNKIMKDYRVEEVTSMVQDKVRNQYLVSDMPQLRSDLEKAIRTIQKSEDVFIQFVYRMSSEYLAKIKPNFDMLGTIIEIILKKGEGEDGARILKACKEQKSFNLLWKGFMPKQKQQFREKWIGLGLEEKELD